MNHMEMKEMTNKENIVAWFIDANRDLIYAERYNPIAELSTSDLFKMFEVIAKEIGRRMK